MDKTSEGKTINSVLLTEEKRIPFYFIVYLFIFYLFVILIRFANGIYTVLERGYKQTITMLLFYRVALLSVA